MRIKIKEIKSKTKDSSFIGSELTIKGWVRTVRMQKSFAFVEVNDGSTLSNLQVIVNLEGNQALLEELSTGCSVAVTGIIASSLGKGQGVEMQALTMKIMGKCDAETYPLQKKRHSFEFLRTIAHLRPRTNTLGAVARVRNVLAFATHRFFQKKGFLYVHTPLITTSDCEGGGEMFQVTTLDLNHLSKENQQVNYSKDFFSKPAYLTVSGQLNGEIYACSLSDIYTFGPTFRAENSNTSRHLAEFWMIEPEMAFADLHDNIDLAEAYLKEVADSVLNECVEDMEFFDQRISPGIIERLRQLTSGSFERITYTAAIEILQKANKKFEFPINWGNDLQTEHERFLAEEFFKKAVVITDYPKEIKAFYMRSNDDQKTVAAMDIVVPKIGELVGGSQREERLELLEAKMKENSLPLKDYWWYLELRKYGSVPHAGFGVGFERLVQFATGMENIRDVIPFPRYPGNAEF